MLKVVFLGTPSFVEPVRKAIEENFEIIENIGDSDLIVVASYGRILSKSEIETPKYGAINIHPSALPKFRGPSPLQIQILEGIKESAITFIKMDKEVDHGPILASIPFEFLDDDTFESAAERAFKIAASAIPGILNEYVQGKIKPVEQNHSKATYTKHLEKSDGFIDTKNPPPISKLERTIRAYYPWPGVYTKFKIKDKITAREAKIVKFLPNDKIQVEGRRQMSYKDFVNGYKEGKEFLKRLNLFH